MIDIQAIKEMSRRALHSVLAASSVYSRDGSPLADAMPVRWHNKLQRRGALGDFDVEVIEGIDRLVFQLPDLEEVGIEPARGDRVSIQFAGGREAVYVLEAEEPADGPLNVYWAVSRVT